MNYQNFDVDKNLKEQTRHGDSAFPMAAYLQRFDINERGYVILHWHEEFQFCLVTKGTVRFWVNNRDFDVQRGQGIFINARCLHGAKPISGRECEYICIDIRPSMIFGMAGNRLCTQYVEPVLHNEGLAVIHFSGEQRWHESVLRELGGIVDQFESQAYGFELAVYSNILRIWEWIAKENEELIRHPKTSTLTDQRRLEKLIDYIQENYKDRVKLDDIARAACISTGECCRIFKRNLQVSPIEYLIHFRIIQSVSMLTNTDLGISAIANEIGFSGSSYYSECFKKVFFCTPTEYRKSNAIQHVGIRKGVLSGR